MGLHQSGTHLSHTPAHPLHGRFCVWYAAELKNIARRATAGKEPLLYTMVQLLSLQLQGAVAYLARDPATRAFRVDAVHLGLALHAAKLLDAGGQSGKQCRTLVAV